MTTFYSPVEVIEIAVKIEETGEKFYSNTAKKTKSKKLSELFQFLAGEEAKHAVTFRKLYHTIKETPYTLPYDFDEIQQYLRALIDSIFFLSSNTSYISKVTTPTALLNYALAFEKDTVLFYLEIINLVKEKDKKLVDKIIAQEKGHISKLSAMKEGL